MVFSKIELQSEVSRVILMLESEPPHVAEHIAEHVITWPVRKLAQSVCELQPCSQDQSITNHHRCNGCYLIQPSLCRINTDQWLSKNHRSARYAACREASYQGLASDKEAARRRYPTYPGPGNTDQARSTETPSSTILPRISDCTTNPKDSRH
jgi:hypothetical protein